MGSAMGLLLRQKGYTVTAVTSCIMASVEQARAFIGSCAYPKSAIRFWV